MASMNCGFSLANRSLLCASPVSRVVPSAMTILADTIILSLLACVPQFMPEALFITMPPTIALFIDAGSGANFMP